MCRLEAIITWRKKTSMHLLFNYAHLELGGCVSLRGAIFVSGDQNINACLSVCCSAEAQLYNQSDESLSQTTLCGILAAADIVYLANLFFLCVY